jgi:hypothetical protein
MQLSVRSDIRQVERMLTNLRKNGVRMAAARAINDTIITLRAQGARAIKRDHPALRIGDIKDNMTLKRAHKFNLRGIVATSGRPLSAMLFQPRGGNMRKRGGASPVTLRIGQGRAQVMYRGRLGFRIKAYGNEVFVRTHGKGRAVRRFRGPSLPGVFRAKGDEFTVMAEQRWIETFRSRLRYEIELAKRSV